MHIIPGPWRPPTPRPRAARFAEAFSSQQIDNLIAEGADFTRANALHFCAFHDANMLLRPFLSRNADINALDQSGLTPLMIAASKVREEKILESCLGCSMICSHRIR